MCKWIGECKLMVGLITGVGPYMDTSYRTLDLQLHVLSLLCTCTRCSTDYLTVLGEYPTEHSDIVQLSKTMGPLLSRHNQVHKMLKCVSGALQRLNWSSRLSWAGQPPLSLSLHLSVLAQLLDHLDPAKVLSAVLICGSRLVLPSGKMCWLTICVAICPREALHLQWE